MNTSMKQRKIMEEKRRQRVLLTGGRAPATLDLARQFAMAGHQVYMAESSPVHLCNRTSAVVRNHHVPKPNENPDAYIQALIDIIVLEKIDWLIPTCEEVFFVARGSDTLRQYCNIFTDSLDKLLRLHSKWGFICRVKGLGLHTPTTHLLTSNEEVKAALAIPGKWVFKPVYSRFATKVFIVQTNKMVHDGKSKDADVTMFIEKMKHVSSQNPWVVQKFIEGMAYCSYSVAKAGELTAHAVYPVRFTAGPGACISFEAVQHPQIDRWVEHFVRSELYTGQIAFDFIVTESDQVYPIECNPRATSGIHLFRKEDQLDRAFLADKDKENGIITPDSKHRAMISLAMLSLGLSSIRSWSMFTTWLRWIVSGKDVVFRLRDPQPFFQQFKLLWWNLRVSQRQRISIIEATTNDIEWNGGEGS